MHLVSIIIPTFNRGHLILETLESVKNQSYANWECIIVDDGSTDDGIRGIKQYIKDDSRFILVNRPQEKPKGANACRNYGVQLCRGDFINFLDSDDLLGLNKIEVQIAALVEYEANLSVCPWSFFDANENVYDLHVSPKSFKSFDRMDEFLDYLALNGIFFPSHAYMLSRPLVQAVGDWDEELIINQDGDYFARVFTLASKIRFVPDTAVYYRRSADVDTVSSINSSVKAREAIESWIRIEKYYVKRFGRPTLILNATKKMLYSNLKLSFPETLAKHPVFFKDYLPKQPNIFIQYLKRIKKRIHL